MSGIIEKFSQILKELEQYQNDPAVLSDALDGSLFQDVVSKITLAIHDKSADVQISSYQLASVRASCVAFKHTAVNSLIFEQLQPFCDKQLQERKLQCKAILDFIEDFKALRDPSHLNLAHYKPEFFQLLSQLLQKDDVMSYLRATDFETLFAVIKSSQFFNNQDLRAWTLISIRHVEQLFKGLLISEGTVKPTCHEGGEYQFDPIVLMRFKAQRRYVQGAQSARSTTVPKEPVTEPLSRSLPNSPKEAIASSSTSSSISTHIARMPAESSPIVPLLRLEALRKPTSSDSATLHLEKDKETNYKTKSKHSCK